MLPLRVEDAQQTLAHRVAAGFRPSRTLHGIGGGRVAGEAVDDPTAQHLLVLGIAFALAGVGIGCAETAEHAAVAALAPDTIRGSACGLLATVPALGNVAESVIAGLLYTLASPTAASATSRPGCSWPWVCWPGAIGSGARSTAPTA